MNTKKSCQQQVAAHATMVKREWSKPSLQVLKISETNGAPGIDQGDGAAPFIAKPKMS